MNHTIKIILIVFLGTILCGLLSGAWWYFIAFNNHVNDGGILNLSKENWALLWSLIGIICGCLGGVILSLIIGILGIPKVPSFFIGAIVNGITPIIFFLWLAEGDLGNISEAPKYFWLSLLGQPVIGGVVGLFISIMTSTRQNQLN